MGTQAAGHRPPTGDFSPPTRPAPGVADPANAFGRASPARVARLFLPYRAGLCMVVVLVFASTLVALVNPFLIREIMDVALPHHEHDLLTLLVAGMLAVAVVNSCLNVWQAYLSTKIGQRVMHDLRVDVYAHLHRMSLPFFTATRIGDVQSRFAHDIGGMQATVTNTAATSVANVTLLVATVVAMAALDWKLTIASLLLLPYFVWISRRVGTTRRRITREKQQQLSTISSAIHESLSIHGFLLGQSMGRTRALQDAMARDSTTLANTEIAAEMAGRWTQSTVWIIMGCMPAITYWFAGMSGGGAGTITLGTLVAFTTLQQNLLRPAVQIMDLGMEFQSSLELFDRIFEYLDLPIDRTESAHPTPNPVTEGHLRFTDVSFAYPEAQSSALKHVNLDVPSGRHLAVVGATGSGKTTLSYLIPRLYDATSGSITIDGVDVRDMSFDDIAAAVGMVFQETYLFHATIAENLRFAKPEATDEELVAAARLGNILEVIRALPAGFDTLVGEHGFRFSGGERQRLALARVALREPKVLVLDEATSALDSQTETAVQVAIEAASRGRTTVTIAHRLSTIRDADEIVVLDQGFVAERGTHDDLIAQGGRYARWVEESSGEKRRP